MQAILNQPNTENSTAEITLNECVNLIKMLDGITHANNALPPTMAKFVAKNSKKIKALGQKLFADESFLQSQYFEKDEKGRNVFWDKQEERTDAEGTIVPDNEQAINGIKAYQNQAGQLIDAFTSQPVLPNKIPFLVPYIKGEEREKEYLDKIDKFYQEKREVHVVKISQSYLEENSIAIPTKIQYPNTRKVEAVNLDTFYEHLVIDEQYLLNGTDTEQKN